MCTTARAPHSRAAARQMDPIIDMDEPGHAMDGNRHIGPPRPSVGFGIVDLMMRKHAVRSSRWMFAAKGMEATINGDAVEAASSL